MYIFVAIKSVSVRSQPKGDVHVRKAPCPQAMQCNLKYQTTLTLDQQSHMQPYNAAVLAK